MSLSKYQEDPPASESPNELSIMEKCITDRLDSLCDDTIKSTIDTYMNRAESSLQHIVHEELKFAENQFQDDFITVNEISSDRPHIKKSGSKSTFS